MNNSDKLWVIIPAFNEGKVIAGVVNGIRALYPHIVVIDDCSDDDTGAIAYSAGATVLRHSLNLGQGAALQTGISYTLTRGAEMIVTFDADGQHRVEDIAVLLAKQVETGADVVMGSRFLGKAENILRLRKWMLKLAVIFSRLTSGVQLTDAHNGLRLLTRRTAQCIRIRQNRMAYASEIVNQISANGLSVVEVPVTIVYSNYSLNKGQKLGNAFNILAELFVARLNK